jgi:hypothetical protein
LAGDDPVWDMIDAENDIELTREAEEETLHSMAKVYNLLEMRQDSQHLHITQKKSHNRIKQMTAVRYSLDTEVIINASLTTF